MLKIRREERLGLEIYSVYNIEAGEIGETSEGKAPCPGPVLVKTFWSELFARSYVNRVKQLNKKGG